MATQLLQNHELFESILEGLPDAIIIADRSQRIVFANRVLTELFSLKRDPVGRDIVEVVLDHRISRLVKQAIDSDHAVTEQLKLTVGVNGGSREITLSITAESIDANLIKILLRDDTQRVETEQVRRDFVANASHELRTPLSIINGYIENLLDGAIENEALARRFLGIMKKHGDRIARIVEDMLTISKFESATQDPTRAGVFDLHSCVNDVIERLHPLVEEKEATLQFTPSDKDAFIAGDRFYWDQIFFNLIENALKQNLNPGLRINVLIEDRGDDLQITVSDSGVGIPQSDLPFIFKRFYRVEKHHSKEIKGTGLGLSIVKRAVEAHGGTVSARSVPGQETAFVIVVPKASKEAIASFENASN